MTVDGWFIISLTAVIVGIGAYAFVRMERRTVDSIRSEPIGPAVCADCRHRIPLAHIAYGHVCDHPTRYREWRDAVSGEIKSNLWERECSRFNSRGECRLFEPRPEGVPWPTWMPPAKPPLVREERA